MQQFAVSMQRAQSRRQQAIQAQPVNNTVNAQTPNRPGFPIEDTKELVKRFGSPVNAVTHSTLRDSNDQPLIGFQFGRSIVQGLDPYVFASKALMDAGFNYDNFANALIDGDDSLHITCHEGSNDIYISPKRGQVARNDAAMAAMARFASNDEE